VKIVGTMPARNSAWAIGLTARAALRWMDALVILNHASTDATGEIIARVAGEHPGRVLVLDEPDPTWAEMIHRQRLLDAARQIGATHIAIVDDDELLSGNLLPVIRSHFEMLGPKRLLQLPWLMCWRSAQCFRDGDNSVWSNNWVSTGFQDHRALHWAIPAGEYHVHHRHPRGPALVPFMPIRRHEGGLLHFQHVSWRRLLAKQALYQMTEVIRWPGRKPAHQIAEMYCGTVNEAGLRMSPIPDEWYAPYSDILHHMDVDAEPWQEAECRRLVAEHGREKFAGLNLFGVV
jgi:hypothetical protein